MSQWAFCPPLGLEFIAAVLRPYANVVEVRDLRKEPGTTRDFLRPETDLVCFSINWERDVDLIRAEIDSVPPGLRVVVGGRHATEDPERWLKACPNIDIVVRGDGEEAMEEFCRDVPWDQITGISYRSADRFLHTPTRVCGPLREDLYPDRRLRNYTYPVELEGLSTGILLDTVAGSRGCPFSCRFCSFNRNPWGSKRPWSARSPESVVKELEEIEAPFVAFMDDIFTHDVERVERICDLLLQRGIRKKYIINARLEIARHPGVLKKMERAGFMMLLLGIESAQDKTLRAMGKGFNTAKIREYFQTLRHSRMILLGYFIVGLIGEDEAEMMQIASFARELSIDTLNLTNLRASPYSGLEELVAQTPGYHIMPGGKIYSDQYSYEELRRIRRTISRTFNTPAQLGRLARKAAFHGALKYLPAFLWRVPGIALQAVCSSRQRQRRRAGKAKPRPAV